jgi:PAS domain S-box-containing protein
MNTTHDFFKVMTPISPATSQAAHIDSRMAEQRLQLLIDSVIDYAICMLTPDGCVDSWNSGAQRIKGYTAKEIIGRHFSCFYTEGDRAAGMPQRALDMALSTGQFSGEGWRVRKDGSRFWASVVIHPIRDNGGQLVGFAKITRDFTERRQAQEALRESEQRFRLLVQGVSDYAIYMLSPEGDITNWNTGAERIKGYTADEVVGSHFSRFYTDEDRAANLPATALDNARRDGRFEHEGWRVRKDGSRFWAQVVVDAVHDEQGKLIGFAKITRDITERRRAAQELELARASLFQSQKMEAIGRLSGGIAHDFNNMLAGIMGNLELIRFRIAQGHLSDLGRHIDAALSATKRSAALTHQLLAYSRRQTLDPKPVDVNFLVNGMADLLRRTVGPAIEIETQLADHIWWTLCDANQLESTLLNLSINARDAMPNGGKLRIETCNITAEEVESVPGISIADYICLSVTDNGIGMTPDVAARAFEPFFTTKPLGEGTGLGLSMIYGFVNQSGGHISIDSTPNQGTTMRIYLPRQVNPTEQAAPPKVMAPPPVRPTVLLVDDEPVVRTMLAEMLKEFGYEIVQAADAADGLQQLKATPDIALMVTDIGLPGNMDGRQLADAARALLPELQILFVTGYAKQSIADHGSLPPGMQLLVKPFTMDVFSAKVKSMVEEGAKA